MPSTAEPKELQPMETVPPSHTMVTPDDQLGLVVHRSEWALERNANVFIWWPTGRIIACFNDAVTLVTVQTLLRWLGIPTSDDEAVVIKRISLQHYDVLEYTPQPQPDSEPLESSHILTKGVYGCFVQDPNDPTRMPTASPWAPVHPAGTFKLIQETKRGQMSLRGAEVAKYDQNMEIPDATRQGFRGPRDICAFTGSRSGGKNGPVDLHWIFPPHMYEKNGTKGAPRNYDLSSRKVRRSVTNVLPMCEAVHKLWFENEFSVDVEDHYRIRTFTQAAVEIGLPEQLIASEALKLSDMFFREHFLHTTLIRVRGGDIHKQADIRDLKAAVNHHIGDLKRYGAQYNPKDEIWQSEVGKDAFKLLGPEDLLPDVSRADEGNGGVGDGEYKA